jgi:DNA-binding MarR family transcriptional regulator
VRDLSILHEALLDLTGVLNRPQADARLIAAAGVDLDRALFPLLVRVERRGPLAIGELADQCGRDYTTVSRQVTTLERLGLVARQVNAQDARVRDVAVTPKGRAISRKLDRGRERLMTSVFASWDRRDVAMLARLLRKLAEDAARAG